MKEDYILVGQVLRAHGIKGELKVVIFTDTSDVFIKLTNCLINENKYKIEHCRTSNGFIILKLSGIDTRNQAELINGEIYAKKSEISLSEGRFFISDLLGFSVQTNEKILGVLKDVYSFKSVDTFFVKGEHNNFSFPALKTVILDINTKSRTILLDQNELKKVIVYAK
ncbi:MAG TPA: ribosome maturation factor RimM [Clostridia bacterium]|jgi:16S rRNA processing protein RimM|nr:ribosome maturation factor RimM [Clostridia bacterium]